jgi:predicted nuclease of predicted toxin-antitoxin system
MEMAKDEEILALAIGTGSLAISLDADFHALVAVRGWRKPSVIRLRREGCVVSIKEFKTTIERT